MINLIEPGRPAYPLMAMLRIHLMQNWFGYSDSDIYRNMKGHQYFFGMQAHVDEDAESSLVRGLAGTAASVADVTRIDQLKPRSLAMQSRPAWTSVRVIRIVR